MQTKKRTRRVYSIKEELITKSREAALSAVQIYNSPLITFKSEIFIMLMVVAWTYLLHAYYRHNKIEYRYFDKKQKKKFIRTSAGAYKYWDLSQCLKSNSSPIDNDCRNNLEFLIGIRNEIEHQMTTRIDDSLSAKFQACCLNYNEYAKKWFGEKVGIDQFLSVSLQFSSMSREQVDSLPHKTEMPAHIQTFIEGFHSNLSQENYNSPKFAYRVMFIAKLANRKNQADEVIEFVAPDAELAEHVKRYVTTKEVERQKYLPTQIVKLMQTTGYPKFTMHQHTQLWKQLDAKNKQNKFGVQVQTTWYWYEKWIDEVKKHCHENTHLYK